MAAAPAGVRSSVTPPGTTRSIISRWPKAAAQARSTPSRSDPHRLAQHQPDMALVQVAQPFLQPGHRLALDVEAEMPGLDDAGMDRADRDLVHAIALDGEEFRLRHRVGRRARPGREGRGARP